MATELLPQLVPRRRRGLVVVAAAVPLIVLLAAAAFPCSPVAVRSTELVELTSSPALGRRAQVHGSPPYVWSWSWELMACVMFMSLQCAWMEAHLGTTCGEASAPEHTVGSSIFR